MAEKNLESGLFRANLVPILSHREQVSSEGRVFGLSTIEICSTECV